MKQQLPTTVTTTITTTQFLLIFFPAVSYFHEPGNGTQRKEPLEITEANVSQAGCSSGRQTIIIALVGGLFVA